MARGRVSYQNLGGAAAVEVHGILTAQRKQHLRHLFVMQSGAEFAAAVTEQEEYISFGVDADRVARMLGEVAVR